MNVWLENDIHDRVAPAEMEKGAMIIRGEERVGEEGRFTSGLVFIVRVRADVDRRVV